MDPPPRPSTDRFRIRVAVFAPEDTHNLQAAPKHTFVVAKSQNFPLQDLPLRELRDVAIRRYKDIYPLESLFQISKSTDSYGSDLFLDDRVGDIFADNEVFRVIKGASLRESLPPNYLSGRAGSIQPSHHLRRKRSPATSNLGDISRGGKRQRVHEPDQPLPSCEGDLSDSDDESIPSRHLPHENAIPGSQGPEIEYGDGVARSSVLHEQETILHSAYRRRSLLSPNTGEDVEERADSNPQAKKEQAIERTIKKSSAITPTNQSPRIFQNAVEPQEDRPSMAKTTPKSSRRGTGRISHTAREWSEDISEVENHESMTQSRGIRNVYSDVETDLEEPSSIIERRGGVTRLSKDRKLSPGISKLKLSQNGHAEAKSKVGATSKSASPKVAGKSIPRHSLLTARKVNGIAANDNLKQNESHADNNVTASDSDDIRNDNHDAGAEQAVNKVSGLTAAVAEKRRAEELQLENLRKIEAGRKAVEAAKKEQEQEAKAEADKKAAEVAEQDMERAAAAEKSKVEAEKKKAELEIKQEKQRLAAIEKANMEAERAEAKRAEANAREETTRKQSEAITAREARAKERAEKNEREAAETAERLEAEKREVAKAAKTAQDKKDVGEASARKKPTPVRSPGGMLARAVAAYSPDKVGANPGANGVDMLSPVVPGRQSTSPILPRTRSHNIKMATPMNLGSIDGNDSRDPANIRRVSFLNGTPSPVRRPPGGSSQPQSKPSRSARTVNGILSSGNALRQSKIVLPGVGVKTVESKIITPTSSTSGQKTKITPTSATKGNISPALLDTINKNKAAKKPATPEENAINISSDETSDVGSVGELELPPPLPPSTYPGTQKPQPTTPARISARRSPSNASSSISAATTQSQRESRSPVQFVNSNIHSQAGSSTQSFDGSRQPKFSRSNEIEMSERSSSEGTDSDSEAETVVLGSKLSVIIPCSPGIASRHVLPPAPKLMHPPPSPTTPKPRGGDQGIKGWSITDEERKTQKLLDDQLTNGSVSSSSPARKRAYTNTPSAAASPPSSRTRNQLAITPTTRPKPRLANGNSATKPALQPFGRPVSMAILPSLRQKTAEALEHKDRNQERARKKGEAALKALKDKDMARFGGALPSDEEESEDESDSSSGSKSESEDEKSEESDASNDVEMGGTGPVMGTPKRMIRDVDRAPATASKAEGIAQKEKRIPKFGNLHKRFSLSQGQLR